MPLRNIVVTNTVPVAIVQALQPKGGFRPTVQPRALRLLVAGLFNGVPSIIRVENRAPLLIDISADAFSLRGSVSFHATDPLGNFLPLSISIDVRGQPSTPAGRACADLSPQRRLFGFEDPLDWTSGAARVSLVTSPVTQGCGALGIEGQHYMPIAGGRFSTVGLTVGQAITTDLFIPSNQPNPYWLGALQMYLTCPSGNVFNQFIGQVELTGRPQGQFSALRFPVGDATRSTLASPLEDCAFSFALNVNPTGRMWVLDNLRFT
ncbi:MAG: hypothetical protein H7210_04635, partial [Pyrinomonadaceae bacterium]|nr:hypothetical protein [Phycisphaerales bacterium]